MGENIWHTQLALFPGFQQMGLYMEMGIKPYQKKKKKNLPSELSAERMKILDLRSQINDLCFSGPLQKLPYLKMCRAQFFCMRILFLSLKNGHLKVHHCT